MPCFFSREFTDFFIRSGRVWLYYNSERDRIAAEEVSALALSLYPDDLPIPGISPFSSDLASDLMQSYFTPVPGNVPDSAERAYKVRGLIGTPLQPDEHVRFVLQIYICRKLRQVLSALKNPDVFLKRERLSSETWKLNKILNSAVSLFLPGFTEEDVRSMIRILDALYGMSFTEGFKPVLNDHYYSELSQSLSGVPGLLNAKNNAEGRDFLFSFFSDLSRLNEARLSPGLRIFFLLEALEGLSFFLEKNFPVKKSE
jgi:hypothetical protein